MHRIILSVFYLWIWIAGPLTQRMAVNKWYSEVVDFDFTTKQFNHHTGHFSQVLLITFFSLKLPFLFEHKYYTNKHLQDLKDSNA